MESFVLKVMEGLTSQCGLAGATLLIGWAYTMWQLAKERAGRDDDRVKAMAVAERRATAFEEMARRDVEIRSALSEIHGYLLAIGRPRDVR